jgi:hypothetical protein
MPRDEEPITIIVSGDELAPLKKLDFPCSQGMQQLEDVLAVWR